MALSLVQTAKYTGTVAQTNMTFTLGSTPTVGNRLLFIACYWTGDDPVKTPTGWTQQDVYNPNQAGVAVFYRDVQSGDGKSWNLDVMTAADQNSGFLLEVAGGASGASFFNHAIGHSTTTSATSLATASITPSVVGCLVITAFTEVTSAHTDGSSTPSGWTKDQYANSSFQPALLYHRTALTTDTTTAISETVTGLPSGVNISSSIIMIAPASGASPQTITPSFVSRSASVFAPTVKGKNTLTPSFISHNPSTFAPTVKGSNTLAPPFVSHSPSLYAPTLLPGAVTIHPGVISSAPTVYTPMVKGKNTLAPSNIARTPTVYAPTLTNARQLLFNGTSDYIQVPDSTSLRFDANNAFTIAIWVKVLDYSNNLLPFIWNKGAQYLCIMGDNTNAEYGHFGLGIANQSDQETEFWGDTVLTLNQWYQVTFTFDGATGNGQIYLNGVAENMHIILPWTPGDTLEDTTGFDFFVAKRGVSTDRNANIEVSGLQIYNRVLTGAELHALYPSDVISGGNLVGYYQLRETSGMTVVDSSGYGNDGTLTGATRTDDTPVPSTLIAERHRLTTGSSTDATSYVTASTTSTAYAGTLVWVYSIAASAPNTPTISASGFTFTQVATVPDSSGLRRLTLFRCMPTTTAVGALTISFGGQTQTGAAWSISEFAKVDTGGTNGASAIVQSVTGTTVGNATSLTVTLSAFADSANATAGGFGIPLNTAGLPAAGGSFTLLGQRNQSTPNLAMGSEFAATNQTSVNMTSSTSSVPWAGIAVELAHETSFVLAQTIMPSLVSRSASVFAPIVKGNNTLAPSFLSRSPSIFAPTLQAKYTILPSFVGHAPSIFAPTIGEGPVTISPSLIASAPTVFAVSLKGVVTILLSKVTHAAVVYDPTVENGRMTISPAFINRIAAIYAPVIIPGAVTITPEFIQHLSAIFAPDVSLHIAHGNGPAPVIWVDGDDPTGIIDGAGGSIPSVGWTPASVPSGSVGVGMGAVSASWTPGDQV